MCVCRFWTCLLEECCYCPYIFYPRTIIGSSNSRISNIGIHLCISRRVTSEVRIDAVRRYSYLKRIAFGLFICYSLAISFFPRKRRLPCRISYRIIPFLINDYSPTIELITWSRISLECVAIPVVSKLRIIYRRIIVFCTLDYVLCSCNSSSTNRIDFSYYVFACHNYA